ncbi:hypothetical protein CBS101457_002525 [Exobasidium rhododendri]|nr:hypothetical protein CBS101457_002525 [Exobasidium rhododendri]
MPDKSFDTPFEPIDTDPHFRRVVGNFRNTDYVAWGTATAAFPSSIYMMELFDSTKPKAKSLGSALRLATFLGACGGFLYAYQRSSFRLWGWSENGVEKSRAEQEGPGYGTDGSKSDMDPYMQGVAHRNSAYSQLKFSVFPWFNIVHHPHHGPQSAKPESSDE